MYPGKAIVMHSTNHRELQVCAVTMDMDRDRWRLPFLFFGEGIYIFFFFRFCPFCRSFFDYDLFCFFLFSQARKVWGFGGFGGVPR